MKKVKVYKSMPSKLLRKISFWEKSCKGKTNIFLKANKLVLISILSNLIISH